MQKLLIFTILLIIPFVANCNNIAYSMSQKSEIKIEVIENELRAEISLLDGYKIVQPDNIKFSVQQKNHIEDVIIKTTDTSYQPNKYFLKFVLIKHGSEDVAFTGRLSFPICKDNCILEEFILRYTYQNNKANVYLDNLYGDNDSRHSQYNLFYILCFALFGGVILNFMPCVLPIIGIKLAALRQNQDNPSSTIHLCFTICGIILSYLFIALSIIILQTLGQYHGFGFYFQNTYFILCILVLLTLAASSMLDRIILPLPYTMLNYINNASLQAKSAGMSGLIAGFFAALMSTSCTAPFVSIATTYALQASKIEIMLIFLMIGIGLASPLILIMLCPKLGRIIPKSGPWVKQFKRVMAGITYLAIFWFIYTLSIQLSNVSALIALMLILLLKFFIEQPTNILFKCSALAIVLICLFTMPSQMNQHELEEDRALSEIWHKFDINEIEHQLNQNKIVLVDITASWCATCQINKLLVLDTDFFTRIAKAKNIYAMRADVSRSIDPQVKRFMSMHSAHAIPLNVVYAPTMRKGIKLDTFLTPAHLSNTISSFK